MEEKPGRKKRGRSIRMNCQGSGHSEGEHGRTGGTQQRDERPRRRAVGSGAVLRRHRSCLVEEERGERVEEPRGDAFREPEPRGCAAEPAAAVAFHQHVAADVAAAARCRGRAVEHEEQLAAVLVAHVLNLQQGRRDEGLRAVLVALRIVCRAKRGRWRANKKASGTAAIAPRG